MTKNQSPTTGGSGRPTRRVRLPGENAQGLPTVGEVFTYNHYPERLHHDRVDAIEKEFLSTEELKKEKIERDNRDAKRAAARRKYAGQLLAKQGR